MSPVAPSEGQRAQVPGGSRAPVFDWLDARALEFFDAHGFVIVTGVLADHEMEQVTRGWDEILSDAATRFDMAPSRFVERFPQNRDLWRKNARFEGLLRSSLQATVAGRFLRVSGVRLFHDHAICKPSRASGAIPWHQDSAYWPLDRVGLSLWTSVRDVPPEGGCLKVLDGSHRDGPAEPQDFLAGGGGHRDGDPRRLALPVRRGETVILNGLTWHGSDPNEGDVDRLAYLTLWVPAAARFVPEHAGWHPTARHIHVRPGQRIEGEHFPLFGEVPAREEGEVVVFPVPPVRHGPSMFTAGRDIAAQLVWLLGVPPVGLDALLEGRADTIVARALSAGLISYSDREPLREVLRDLALQERVRREHVARDVYLGTVQRYWRILGERLAEARDAGASVGSTNPGSPGVQCASPLPLTAAPRHTSSDGVALLTTASRDALLARLGLEAAAPGARSLLALQRAWLLAQPFHNIDLLAASLREEPPLGPEQAIERCALGLGGPCHVHAFAFLALLRSLGFDAHLCGATIAHPDDHLLVRVALAEGSFFCDTGNGHPYLSPFPADREHEQRHAGWTVRSRPEAGDVVVERASPDQPAPRRVYRASPAPRLASDFAGGIARHHTEPGFGPFLTGLRAVRIDPDGMTVLRDNTLTRYSIHGHERSDLPDGELVRCLAEDLGLRALPIEEAVRAYLARGRCS